MRIFRILGLLALVATILGCAGVQKPTPEDFAGHSLDVKAPLFEQSVGSLELLRDGRWAVLTDGSDRGPELVKGQFLALGDLEMSFRHLFVVQEIGPWGAYLSRLDSDPLQPKLEGSLFPLGGGFDQAKMERWRLCAGASQEPLRDSCVTSYPVGTLFRFFDSNDLQGFQVPSALIRVGDSDSKLGSIPKEWIALPAGHIAPFSRSRIAVDGCEITHPSLDVVSFKAEDLAHPYKVEEKAFELGVDAFIQCKDGVVTGWVPGLFRARVVSPREIMQTSTLLSSRPVSTKLLGEVNDLAALFAATGAGDFVAATFHAGRLASKHASQASDVLALSAELAPGLNLPDLALHMADLAVQSAWNPENNVYWTITNARVEAQLEQIGRARERWMGIPERVQSDGEMSMNGWMLWNDFLQEVDKNADGRNFDRLLDVAQGPMKPWRDAMIAFLAATQSPELAQGLEPGILKDAFAGSMPNPPSGSSADSAVDVYGILAKGATAKSLSRVGYSVFIPGFWEVKPQGLLETTALLRFKPGLVDELPDMIERELDSGCTNPGLSDQAELLKRRHDDTSLWLVTNALPVLCGSPAAIFEQEIPVEHIPALSMLLDAFFKSGRLGHEYLDRAAEVGRTPNALCHRWLLADAILKFVNQDIPGANASLVKSDQCQDPSMQAPTLALRLVMDFEQTVRLRVVDDAKVMRALQKTLGQRVEEGCLAAGAIEYDLANLFSEEVLSYLPGASLKLRPSESDLLTATTLLTDARTELLAVSSLFTETRVEGGGARLLDLESRFAQIGHQAGLARVRWLQSLIENDAVRKNLTESERALLVDYVNRGEEALVRLKDDPKILCLEAPRSTTPVRLD